MIFLEREKKFYLPFEEAKKLVHANFNIVSRSTYNRERGRNPQLQMLLPSDPYNSYKGRGWIDWNDFTGGKKYLPFLEARELVRANLKIISQETYKKERKKDPKLQKLLPPEPPYTYKDQWIGWTNFHGKEKIRFFSEEEGVKLIEERGFLNAYRVFYRKKRG